MGRRLGATLPPGGFYGGESSAPLAAMRLLLPAGVTLSNAVSQSLARSRSLSICQSAVSHCFIQSPPRPLSLSVWRSFTPRRASLLIGTHLTSSLAHSPALSPTSITAVHVSALPGFSRWQELSAGYFFLLLFFSTLTLSAAETFLFSTKKNKKLTTLRDCIFVLFGRTLLELPLLQASSCRYSSLALSAFL